MEIIEQGEKQEPMHGKCVHCQCVFSFTPHDEIAPTFMASERLRCPNCGRLDVPSSFTRVWDMHVNHKNFLEKMTEITRDVKK